MRLLMVLPASRYRNVTMSPVRGFRVLEPVDDLILCELDDRSDVTDLCCPAVSLEEVAGLGKHDAYANVGLTVVIAPHRRGVLIGDGMLVPRRNG